MGRRHLGKRDAKEIAKERIDKLFEVAKKEARDGNDERSRRYIALALRIGERHKVRTGHKRSYCPHCRSFFVPPRNVRVRTGKGRISMTCLVCGHILRYPVTGITRG
ncbi:MAG: ribonuclease P protein component 4 [Thermoplasmata archaeon]